MHTPERRMEFRIGVNLGDVMVDGEQIFGDGVSPGLGVIQGDRLLRWPY